MVLDHGVEKKKKLKKKEKRQERMIVFFPITSYFSLCHKGIFAYRQLIRNYYLILMYALIDKPY